MKGSFSSSSGHYRRRTPRLPPPPRPTAASGSQVSHTGAPQTHCSPIFPHGYCGKSSTYLRQPPPSFSIELRPSLPGVRHRRNSDLGDQIRALVDKCDHPPEEFRSYSSNGMIATLFYRQWNHARDAFILLWSTRLSGEHTLTPKLLSSLLLPSDKQELNDSVKTLFLDKIDALLEGEQMRNWQKKLAQVLDELGFLRKQMNRKNLLRVHKESNLGLERDMIMKRMEEFKAAMDCIRAHLEDKPEVSSESFVPVFKFVRGEFNWSRIHHLILRECKRLDDGLPIYAHRKEILQSIYLEQIMVLIGETGSGKSTQLTQFIADSGLASGSIVCTQPRKIAAISLSDRVNEESIGCYQDNSIICYPTSSPSQLFRNNVIYMTDHCLLQHYLQDNKLSGISCIIIDEAHERSLNTDLLLAQLKLLLAERECLRLIIMSATADAKLLSDFFYECKIMHVLGRNYPVEIRYTPFSQEGGSSNTVPLYVTEAVRVAKDVHRMNKEGTILTFLTSQAEVEWACDNFLAPSAIALPLHGKLTHEMQQRIFQFFPGKRKVIFATNLAETSLTIPGVRFVVDSGMMKENKFEPTTGMSILRVCTISKSSANQRAGRAGRTEPGVCYRLYSACDFESMSDTQEPEIRRVHLGIAVLRILAFGAKKLQEFEFIDAPSDSAIDTAIRNLIQLGAVTMNHGLCELTRVGRYLVKLGIEPRLGKLILGCLDHNLGREGVALAAMMANSSSIFCRVGSDVEKLKADSLKVQFCHQYGDLFTLLSVYKHWVEKPHLDIKNKWCWENSINAKAMRRCHETVKELEDCLRRELCMDIPSMWRWNPHKHSSTDKHLQKVILSCLVENVAMYTGLYRLGYEVAVTGQQIQLHPSCSLLVFGERPSWVVFSEILSVSNTYLVCVTAFDFEWLSMLCPPPPFEPLAIENRKLVQRLITGYGSTLLKRFCGKFNSNLNSLLSRIRTECSDNRVSVEVDANQNEVSLFASSEHMERVFTLVNESLEYERKHLLNECIENSLYHGSGSTPVALLGAGAEIKHVELKKNTLSIDVYHPVAHPTEDKELMMALEKSVDGIICSVHKYLGSRPDGEDRFCRVTFTTPEAARRALELRKIILSGAELKFLPSQTSYGNNSKAPFHGVKARVRWPRKQSIGVALVAVNINDVFVVLSHFSNITIGGERVYCERVNFREHNIAVREIPRELSEGEVYDALSKATNRRILDLFLRRGRPVENPPAAACEDALIREISPLMPRLNSVQVSTPQDKDAYMKALITFDAELHLEAAAALESIQGRVLPGFLPWQKIEIQQQFQTSLFCSPQVYHAIKEELDSIFSRFKHRKGVEYNLDRSYNGGFRVSISANATRTVAEMRKPIEALMQGKTVDHEDLTPLVLQILFSLEGVSLMRSVQNDTRTHIIFDRYRRTIRVFGSPRKVTAAEERLVRSLIDLHKSKQLEIHLRRRLLPPNLMKELVDLYGPELNGLKQMIPDAEISLNVLRQVISIGGDKDAKQKAEKIISEIVSQRRRDDNKESHNIAATTDCPICLCDVEDGYRLEGCLHLFCRSCLVEQCESAIKDFDIIPICCAREGCNAPILVSDLRTLLPAERLEELFRASIGRFVVTSEGRFRFCPSPDCPSIYQVGTLGEPFVCGACFAEMCSSCHMEYHPYISCERYKQFKDDPDLSLKEWCQGKKDVKVCPVCGHTIEKIDGCNHIECRCGRHICWECLQYFSNSDLCYGHLRSVHLSYV